MSIFVPDLRAYTCSILFVYRCICLAIACYCAWQPTGLYDEINLHKPQKFVMNKTLAASRSKKCIENKMVDWIDQLLSARHPGGPGLGHKGTWTNWKRDAKSTHTDTKNKEKRTPCVLCHSSVGSPLLTLRYRTCLRWLNCLQAMTGSWDGDLSQGMPTKRCAVLAKQIHTNPLNHHWLFFIKIQPSLTIIQSKGWMFATSSL